MDEENTFLFTSGVLIRLFGPLSTTSVMIYFEGRVYGLFLIYYYDIRYYNNIRY